MPEIVSLYRRHRPRTFAQVVGQEHVVRTLRNAVEQGKVHHAYLFVGSRGTGKTSMAKILAACLNCSGTAEQPRSGPTTEPCGVCDSCRAIAAATSLDVIEMDAASNNSVDDIRDLRDRVAYAPVSGRHKVYILDEAHMLSSQAWNAFLKTLEEPPPHTIFVLATTEASKVLPTVVDRCHRFDFARPSLDQLAAVLRRVAEEESIAIDPEAVALIARHATGSFRDALGTLEQLLSYTGADGPARVATGDVLAVLGVADADLLFDTLDAIAGGEARGALQAAAQLAATGRDATGFVRDLEAHTRDLMVVQTLGEVPAELAVTPDRDARLLEQAGRVGAGTVARLLDLLAAALDATRNGAEPRTQLELALVKAASPDVDPSVQALLARVERLEAALGSRAAAPPPSSVPPPASEPEPEPEPADTAPPPPATAPSPPAPVPPAGGPVAAVAVAVEAADDAVVLDVTGVVALWPAVLDAIKQANSLCAAVLADARPTALADGVLTLAFPPGADFLRRKAEDESYRATVVAALRAVTGQSARVSYEVREVSDADDETEDARPPAHTEEEWLARFVTEFDAVEIPPDDAESERP